ncbi:hypothetical protein Pmar_PMAR013944, partial [Perkinsus marinus ATCC 50983]
MSEQLGSQSTANHNNIGTLQQDVNVHTTDEASGSQPGLATTGQDETSHRERSRSPEVVLDASMARRLLSEKLGVERDLLVFMTSTEANTLIDSVDDLSTRLALRRCWAVASSEAGPVRMMGRSAQPPTQGPVYHAELPVGSKTGPSSTVSFDRLYNDSQDHRSDVKTMTAIGQLPIPGDKVFQGRDDARSVSYFCRELALT